MSTPTADLRGVSRDSMAHARERLEATLAAEGTDLAALGEDLFRFVHLLDSEHTLRRALADSTTDPERKAGVVRSLLGERVGGAALGLIAEVVRLSWARGTDLADASETLAVLTEVTRAEREGHLHDLEDELFRFGRIVDGQPRLRGVLADPSAPPERKSQLLRDLLDGKVRPATLRLLTEVATFPRGRALDRGLDTYGRIAAERRQRLIALVRTAAPLDEEHRRRLADALSAAYGQDIHLNIEVDPEVIGGLSVRVGDEVIDGTIATRLDRARRRLTR